MCVFFCLFVGLIFVWRMRVWEEVFQGLGRHVCAVIDLWDRVCGFLLVGKSCCPALQLVSVSDVFVSLPLQGRLHLLATWSEWKETAMPSTWKTPSLEDRVCWSHMNHLRYVVSSGLGHPDIQKGWSSNCSQRSQDLVCALSSSLLIPLHQKQGFRHYIPSEYEFFIFLI